MPTLQLSEARLSGLTDIDVSGLKAGGYPFPDFLIVGPQRTGSSWLRTNLCKHPQVLMPFKKEIYFFSHLRRSDHKRYRSNRLEPYCELFKIRPAKHLERFGKALCHGLLLPRTIRGEATASYATMPDADIANIFKINPAMKIVIMVRDPIDRSWSHAKKALVRDRKRKFDDVGFQEFESYYRARSNIERGTYSTIIDRWRGVVSDGALMVAEYRKLSATPLDFLVEVQNFLGIASGRRFARKHLHTIVNPTSDDGIPAQHRELLESLFGEEIQKLSREYGIQFD